MADPALARPCPKVASPIFRSGLHPRLVLKLEAGGAFRVGGREQQSTPHPGPSGSNTGDSLPQASDGPAVRLLLGSEGLAIHALGSVCSFSLGVQVFELDSACLVL